MRIRNFVLPGLTTLLALSNVALSQTIQSTVLTDRIYRGDGVIDLLKNISGNNLSSYFNQTGGLLLLGADINEDASGNESNKSMGVAIKAAQLAIKTTAGDFTFSNFFTGTTAMLRAAGSTTASSYYTMFGQGGSSQITGTGPTDISRFDDVMWFENVAVTGAITSAKLRITLLDTPTSRPTAAESFFDFSGGFEEFALFSKADAVLIESANLGTTDAPSGINYVTNPVNAVTAIQTAIAANPPTDTNTGTGTGPGTSTGTPTDAGSTAGTGTGTSTDSGSTAGTGTGTSTDSGATAGTDTGSGTGSTGSATGAPSPTPVSAPPAAPAPPFAALASMGVLVLWKKRNQLKTKNA